MNIFKLSQFFFLAFITLHLIFYPFIAASQQKDLDVISEIKKGNFYVVCEDEYHVKKEYRTPEVKEALYQLLIDSKDDPNFCDPEECRGYHDLLSIMGSIQETRAIPYLTTRLGQGFAQRSMALMGEPALEVVLELWEKGSKNCSWEGDCSWVVVGVLYEMVKEKKEEDYKPKGESRKKTKKILIKALNNKDGVTRIVATRGLGEMASQGDTDVIPLIKKAAKEDSYFRDYSKKPNYTGPKIRYPVREEAQKVLEKLKKEGKIKE